MQTAHIIATILAAAWLGFSAYSLFTKAPWVVDNLTDYGVPTAWWPKLAAAKATGAIGLLVGLAIPPVGLAATVAVAIYFLGAVITVTRAGAYSHVPFPLLYLIPVIIATTLGAGA
jgi:hypothetical protein